LTPHLAIKKAVELAGGQQAAATLLGVSQPTVNAWLNKAERIGSGYALACHVALDGQISAHDLRPDLYPRQYIAIK
jgi:DNA-binding transcriptional regulator YdaS (Cro superfamily)